MKKQKKQLKKIPKFKNEDEERDFWSKADLTDYFETKDFIKAEFPNLKPTTKTISIRLPASMLYDLKRLANKDDIPYQSYIKMILAKELERKRT